MELVGLILLGALCFAGFVLIFFNTSGTALILLGAFVYAIITGFSIISIQTLLILTGLFIAGEILDYVFVMLGAKKFGASNRAVLGAFLGGITGAFAGLFFFGIGVIPGTFAGIFLGAFLFEYLGNSSFQQSLRSGTGSLIGAVASIFIKSILALAMISIIVVKVFTLRPY